MDCEVLCCKTWTPCRFHKISVHFFHSSLTLYILVETESKYCFYEETWYHHQVWESGIKHRTWSFFFISSHPGSFSSGRLGELSKWSFEDLEQPFWFFVTRMCSTCFLSPFLPHQNCLRRRDAGLLNQLQELDKQISDLRLDVEKTSEEQLETDSRPSSGECVSTTTASTRRPSTWAPCSPFPALQTAMECVSSAERIQRPSACHSVVREGTKTKLQHF